MVIVNETKKQIVAAEVRVARWFWQRIKGLLGTNALGHSEGLWIPKCQGVHTFGMRYAIDVLYLDRQHRVIEAFQSMAPGRVGPVAMNASSVLEFAEGVIETAQVKVGDSLLFIGRG